MTLLEIITNLDGFDEDQTIYAEAPWNSSSTAVVVIEPEAGGTPDEAERLGLDYFLEVSIARELLEDWSGGRQSASSPEERCDRVIRYAVDDA